MCCVAGSLTFYDRLVDSGFRGGAGGGAYRSWGMLGPFIHQMSTICMHVHVHMVLCIDASSGVLVYID